MIKVEKSKLTDIKRGRNKSSSSENNAEMTPVHGIITNSDVDSDASVGIKRRSNRKAAGKSADSHARRNNHGNLTIVEDKDEEDYSSGIGCNNYE